MGVERDVTATVHFGLSPYPPCEVCGASSTHCIGEELEITPQGIKATAYFYCDTHCPPSTERTAYMVVLE